MNEIKHILEKFVGYFNAVKLRSKSFVPKYALHTALQQHVAHGGKCRSKSDTMMYLSEE